MATNSSKDFPPIINAGDAPAVPGGSQGGDPPIINAGDAPAAPGAYALIIEVPTPYRPSISTLADAVLQPGRYLYAGSANGPGGMGARIRRHMRKQKPRHWHIDRLTNAFGVAEAFAFEGASECALIEKALKWPGTETPLKGFGASDCGKCPAHLVKLPDDFNLPEACRPVRGMR